jgi:hypothetical protein
LACGFGVWTALAPNAIGAVILAAGTAVLLGIAWRVWRLGIRAGADGVAVVQLGWTRQLSWGEIRCFAIQPLGPLPLVGYVLLHDGRALPTLGLQGPRHPRPNAPEPVRELQEQVDALNALLALQRGNGRAVENSAEHRVIGHW